MIETDEGVHKFFSFFCPITFDVMKDPVIASDGVTYDREAITMWLNLERAAGQPVLSPITREQMTTNLVPNAQLKSALDEIVSAYAQQNGTAVSNVRQALYSMNIDTIPEISGLTRALSSEEFEALDALMHLDLMTKLNLQAPQVIVIGSENHGKSTLLERLIGFPIFPRNRTLCTRCPIRVKLRRQTGAAISKIFVRNRSTNTTDESTVEHVALEMMSDRVNARMDEMLKGQPQRTIISDREIVIEIRVPYCPNIDILDMPGLVAAPKEAADVSFELTKSTIVNERKHSMFLLVVDSRTECNASLATRLVLDHSIETQTIGVFTKMDIFFQDYEGGTESKVDVFNNYTAVSNPGYVPLPKGWMGCASLPGVSPNMKPMERLLLAEKREVALLKKDFTSLWQERKMGMKVIRDCVQHEFEEFMCTDWVHRINAHLKEVFLQLSDKNANLGMPMAPLQSYVPHLQNILSVVPVVFPDFKESMLQVTSTHAFKGILADRVKIVCANSQWIQFGSSKIWATIAAAREQMNARTPQWNAGPVAFDKCLAEAATAKQLLISALCKQADELKAETFALSVKFMAALLEIQKRPNSNVFRTAYNFLLSAFTDEDKPEVHKMERFPRLVEAFRVYIDKAIQESAMKFEAAAKVYIDNVQDVVRIKYRSEGGNVVANLQWREDADAHFDNLINIHLKETLTSLPALTHAFVIPDPLLQEEACAPARAKLLTEMSDIATALIALKRLIDRVEAAKQAANDPCSVNNP